MGDHLAQPVDLAVGHLQHPAHIADDGARLELAEGDDLGDAVAPVFALDVTDDLVAALLAEIDVEVRHRHAVGVQEALEQQPEAQRVEIGDLERPGHCGAGARTPPRPHRNALPLRPLDEIGDDEEITGEAHIDDDVELVGEALAIGRGVDPQPGEAPGETVGGVGAQFRGFVAPRGGETGQGRQQRVARLDAESATPGDRQRVVAGFRQVAEQRPHVRRGLEMVLRSHAGTVALRHIGAVGDAQQGVVRLMHVGGGEKGVVGGDQRQAGLVSEREQAGLRRRLAFEAVALDFHVETARKDRRELVEAMARGVVLAGREKAADRPRHAARQRDQPLRLPGKRPPVDLRLRRVGGEKAGAGKRAQVAVAGLVLREQHDPVRRLRTVARGRPVFDREAEFATDDRLHPGLGARPRDVHRAEQVAGIGDGDRRHRIFAAQGGERVRGDRPLRQRIGGVDPEMNEIGVGHAAPRRLRRGEDSTAPVACHRRPSAPPCACDDGGGARPRAGAEPESAARNGDRGWRRRDGGR